MASILYFDPFNGVSGDMVLGALVDLGLPLEHLKSELAKLQLEPFELHCEAIERQGLRGVNLHVHVAAGGSHSDDVHHAQHERGLQEITRLIEGSGLDAWVKERSIAIFRRLGEAEAKVHGCPLEKVHFHEVGAVDAIVDIVGACVGFKYFEVGSFYTAPLNLGGGTVTFSHGTWPVPAPATAELVKGFPVYLGHVQGELTTPTGAAIVTTLAEKDSAPLCRFERSGFGAGNSEFPGIPNMLRLMLGRTGDSTGSPQEGFQEDEIVVLEASIDDMDAETFGHFLELALKRGALDVYYITLHMKKNRPGVLVQLLCRREDREKMAELIFRETTTLGLRWSSWRRWILDREVREIETLYGPVRIKLGRFRGRVVSLAPEYEDLKAIAERENLPLKLIRQQILEQTIGLIDG